MGLSDTVGTSVIIAVTDYRHVDFRSDNSVVSRVYSLSMLNVHPYSHAVYASHYALPHTTQNSLPVLWLAAYRVGVSNPLCIAPFQGALTGTNVVNAI